MTFEAGRRRGRYWNDAKLLHETLREYPFHTTGRKERDFENGVASSLMMVKKQFNSKVITQIDKSSTVKSVYCFGKKHRPDLAFDENGIAIEIKFITYAGLKEAIGQGYLYRLQYRFVFLVLIISEARKSVYLDLDGGKEKDLADTLQHLADHMNVFTCVAPAFIPGPGAKKCITFFEPVNIAKA
jgi:hypothetical protein